MKKILEDTKFLEDIRARKNVSETHCKAVVLHSACTRGNVAVVTLFAKYHSLFDWATKSNSKCYPLLEAARRKHVALFETLLQCQSFKDCYASKDSFVSMTDGEGNSLLHIAADVEEDVILQFSLDFGVDPTSKNDKGMTPLHYVAMRGNVNACKLLLKYFGDDYDAILSYIESEADKVCKETAVYFAAKHNHKMMLKFLLQT